MVEVALSLGTTDALADLQRRRQQGFREAGLEPLRVKASNVAEFLHRPSRWRPRLTLMRYYFFPRAYAAALALVKHYWQRSETASILRGQNVFVDALSINKKFVYALPRTIRNGYVVNERGIMRGGFSFTT